MFSNRILGMIITRVKPMVNTNREVIKTPNIQPAHDLFYSLVFPAITFLKQSFFMIASKQSLLASSMVGVASFISKFTVSTLISSSFLSVYALSVD